MWATLILIYIPKAVKKIFWHKCFPVTLEKFLRTSFLQNTMGQLLLLLAFQKQPPEAFYEKRCSWKFRKIHRKILLVCEIFKNTFLAEHPWKTASDFFAQRYENGVLPTMFGKPQINIHYLETLTLEVTFRYFISFFGKINFRCMSLLVYTVYC